MTNWRGFFFLLIGIGLIFLSLYLFTKSAFFEVWDFSETGQIGDTIGGITAPLINLLGAYLVYFSFMEQKKANDLQRDALDEEKNVRNEERKFENCLSQYNSIKSHLDSLEFIVQYAALPQPDGGFYYKPSMRFIGLNALNEFVLRVESPRNYESEKYRSFGMLLNLQYLLKSLSDLVDLSFSTLAIDSDRTYIVNNCKVVYTSFLKSLTIAFLTASNTRSGTVAHEIMKLRRELDEKFNL